MKMKFLGTDECKKEITLRGVTFEKGKAKDVKDQSLLRKLQSLPYFEEAKK